MNINQLIASGVKIFGRDTRPESRTAYYFNAADLAPEGGKDLTDWCEQLHRRGAAKALGVTQSQLGNLDPDVVTAAYPAGSTHVRFIGYARRFPEARDSGMSLEVFSAAAAHSLRAMGNAPEGTDKSTHKAKADKAGAKAVADKVKADGAPVSIERARREWQPASAKAKATSQPETVEGRVDWLLGQPKAVAAFVAAQPEKAAALVTLLTA